MATTETVGIVFRLLSRAYPDHAIKYLQGEAAVETMRLYEQLFADVPDDTLKAAAIEHAGASQWFPKPSELRSRCFAIMANVADMPSAYEAWGMVCHQMAYPQHIMRGGKMYLLKDLPPLVERAVEGVGGWPALRVSEDVTADRARFVAAYESLVARELGRLSEMPAVRRARLASKERRELTP